MSPYQTDRQHFERQIVFARPTIILLALLAVLEQPPSPDARRSASFLIAYLLVALLVMQVERLFQKRAWHLPLVCATATAASPLRSNSFPASAPRCRSTRASPNLSASFWKSLPPLSTRKKLCSSTATRISSGFFSGA